VPAQQQTRSQARTRQARQSKPATIPPISQVTPARGSRSGRGTQRPRTRSDRVSRSYPVAEYKDTKRSLGEVSSATPKLAAEWLICVIIIAATQFTKGGDYTLNMSEALWRLTATTGVFFVLAVASMSKRLSGATVAFGFLIVLAILFKSTNEIKTVFEVAAGKGTGQTSDQLDSDTDPGASKNAGHEFVK
jgi:hypothetical protein